MKFWKLIFRLFSLVFLLGVVVLIGAFSFSVYYYFQIVKDLPRIDKISDYRPQAVSYLLANNGEKMAEIFDQRRYPISFEQIPITIRQAFLAAEDSSFYKHPGIDILSIIRALIKNIQHGETVQGGSTITQQVIKSLLLTSEKKYKRKIKEAILSYRLESALSKNEIFEIYLNEIFFGNGAYGVNAASKIYFHKELSELSIAEAAFLAALPQRPSTLSQKKYRYKVIARQHYVIHQMQVHGFITAKEASYAKKEKLDIKSPQDNTIYSAPWFASHVIKEEIDQIFEKFGLPDGARNPGGYKIYTTANIKANEIAQRSVNRALLELDKRRGWRGPLDLEEAEIIKIKEQVYEKLEPEKIYRSVVLAIKGRKLVLQVGEFKGSLELSKSKWAKKSLFPAETPKQKDRFKKISPAGRLKKGSIIEVSIKGKETIVDSKKSVDFILSQTPKVQGAFVLIDPWSGDVKAITGGYDYGSSVFNRATQSLRQPGSSFKPFVYLTAIKNLAYHPSSIVPDSPISLRGGDGEYWEPQNYDKSFIGPVTLRTALQLSRNVVSVYLITKTGIKPVVEVAKKFGISTPIFPGYSIALGTSEVKLIEMVGAYGIFAAGGRRLKRRFVTAIYDRDGVQVYENPMDYEKIIDEDQAFIMAHMMQGVVKWGTAQKLKSLGHPVAGKTGTTDDQMDAWFIGYTPEWVAGAWIGFDMKKNIGRMETGGKAAAPVFLYFMQEWLAGKESVKFEVPSGVVPIMVQLNSGKMVRKMGPGVIWEYFIAGTEPMQYEDDAAAPEDYLSGDEF